MKTLLKTLHFVGLSLFLGSIVAYIVAGAVAESREALAFSRNFVLAGTLYVTIPAMWVVGLTGMVMSGLPRTAWQKAKGIGFVLVALNTHIFIFPAIRESVDFLRIGNQAMFEHAAMTEAVAGLVNILLILALIVTGVNKRLFLASR
ncbi:hypothetical protein [Paludibacterium paludis]|uniref:DUF2269 family protein n=1 Tax=Paludibacterium paludis TaxID=1225769 RepID=A0A918P0Y6_9NEIS|nr:hypothetical protein [Paludibacterium paludis]GGY11280.1 hypothetical protein GCM10011289_12750 [Paludibacterium paludis]